MEAAGGDMASQNSRANNSRVAMGSQEDATSRREVDILSDKNQYIDSKKREEIEELKRQLEQEKARYRSKLEQSKEQREKLEEKHREEMRQISDSHKQTVDLLVAENDKIMGASLAEAIESETAKMKIIHKAELD